MDNLCNAWYGHNRSVRFARCLDSIVTSQQHRTAKFAPMTIHKRTTLHSTDCYICDRSYLQNVQWHDVRKGVFVMNREEKWHSVIFVQKRVRYTVFLVNVNESDFNDILIMLGQWCDIKWLTNMFIEKLNVNFNQNTMRMRTSILKWPYSKYICYFTCK